ncbi:MAG: hypothetical protein IKL10_06060 [Clostridia bacterium]|nr:hypothetical protein [Clostridia bacterium]
MKKHISVFSLIARESIYRIFFVWLLSAGVQITVFLSVLKNLKEDYIPSLTQIIDKSYINVFFFVTIIAVAVFLCKTGMQFNSKTGYTLRRLLISEKAVFGWQCLYNIIMLMLTWLLEVVLCFMLLKIGTNLLPEEFITNQSIYLAFYQTQFIQNLFAGRDIARIIRNILTVISLGVSFAAFSYQWRRGKKWLVAPFATAVLLFYVMNISELGYDIASIFAMLIILFSSLITVLGGQKYDA